MRRLLHWPPAVFLGLILMVLTPPADAATPITSVDDIGPLGVYTIGDVSGLLALRDFVNRGSGTTDYTFELANPIDLGHASPWSSIGSGAFRFRGTFHGHQHAITGLTLHHDDVANEARQLGLFQALGAGALIQDVTLASPVMTLTASTVREVGFLTASLSNAATLERVTVLNPVITLTATHHIESVGAVIGYTDHDLTMRQVKVQGATLTVVSTSGHVRYVGGVIGRVSGSTSLDVDALEVDTIAIAVSAGTQTQAIAKAIGRVDASEVRLHDLSLTSNAPLSIVASGTISEVGGVAGFVKAANLSVSGVSVALFDNAFALSNNANIAQVAFGVGATNTTSSFLFSNFDVTLDTSLHLESTSTPNPIFARSGDVAPLIGSIFAEGSVAIDGGTLSISNKIIAVASEGLIDNVSYLIGSIGPSIGRPLPTLTIQTIVLNNQSRLHIDSQSVILNVGGWIGSLRSNSAVLKDLTMVSTSRSVLTSPSNLSHIGGVLGALVSFGTPSATLHADAITLVGDSQWVLNAGGTTSYVGGAVGQDQTTESSTYQRILTQGEFVFRSSGALSNVGGLIGAMTSGRIQHAWIDTTFDIEDALSVNALGGVVGSANALQMSGLLAQAEFRGVSTALASELAGIVASVTSASLDQSIVATRFAGATDWDDLSHNSGTVTASGVLVFDGAELAFVLQHQSEPPAFFVDRYRAALADEVTFTSTLSPSWSSVSVPITWYQQNQSFSDILAIPQWRYTREDADRLTVSPASVTLTVGEAITPLTEAFAFAPTPAGSGVDVLFVDVATSTLPVANHTVTTAGSYVYAQQLWQWSPSSGLFGVSSGAVSVTVNAPPPPTPPPSVIVPPPPAPVPRFLELNVTPGVVTLEAGQVFTPPAATAFSVVGTVRTDISSQIDTSGVVPFSQVGAYAYEYAIAQSGFDTVRVTILVRVVDTTPPVIIAPSIFEVLEGSELSIPVSTTDNASGAVVVTWEGVTDTSVIGERTITIRAVDAAGNEATTTLRLLVRAPQRETILVSINRQQFVFVVDERAFDLASLTTQVAIGPVGKTPEALLWQAYTTSSIALNEGEVVYVRVVDANDQSILRQTSSHVTPAAVAPPPVETSSGGSAATLLIVAGTMMVVGIAVVAIRNH